jgi:hypothetical protein
MKVTVVKEYPELGEVVATVNYTAEPGEPGELAAAKQTAAEIIRRIEGGAAADKNLDSRLRANADVLRGNYPTAARYFDALADWLYGGPDDFDDFTPPADADAQGNILVTDRDAAFRKEGWDEALNSLIEYLKCPVPPIPDERLEQANAAAEQRGAEKATAQIVAWLKDYHGACADSYAEFIERVKHLGGTQ